MSIIQRIGHALGLERRSNGDNYWSNFAALQTGPVNANTAQGVSAVYACVGAISETVSSLPLILFKRDGEDRQRATDHPLYSALHDQANEHQTALEFREWMMAAVLLRGNAYAKIIRRYDGQVSALLPLSPDRVRGSKPEPTKIPSRPNPAWPGRFNGVGKHLISDRPGFASFLASPSRPNQVRKPMSG